jgi:hypothetical protein
MLDHTFLPAKNGHIESNADAKSTDVLENSNSIIFLYISFKSCKALGMVRSDGNLSHFHDRWLWYQHWPMIDRQWQLPSKCIYSVVNLCTTCN